MENMPFIREIRDGFAYMSSKAANSVFFFIYKLNNSCLVQKRIYTGLLRAAAYIYLI